MVSMQDFKCSHKLMAMVYSPLSTKGQDTLDHKNGKLVGQNFMVGQIHKEFFKKKGKLTPWMEKGA
jgi:hypothetical protein